MVLFYPLDYNARKKKKIKKIKKRLSYFINLSPLSNCVILKLCKTYVNTTASHTEFRKYILLRVSHSAGFLCKGCVQSAKISNLRKHLQGSRPVALQSACARRHRADWSGTCWVTLITEPPQPSSHARSPLC